MRLVICPGVHEPKLTDCFLTGLSGLWGLAHLPKPANSRACQDFSRHKYPPFSPLDILHFLCREELAGESLVFVSFSAGVAGAIGAAWTRQQLGGKVRAFFCLRRLGSTPGGQFPIHRVSPRLLYGLDFSNSGRGGESFYVDPAIEHLDLWRSPKRQKAGTSAKPPPH